MTFNIKQAIDLQRRWARQIIQTPLTTPIKTIAGVDVAFPRTGQNCLAAAVLLSYPDLEFITAQSALTPIEIPYIPGLLSFREAPAIIAAVKKLPTTPDVMIVDGQGLAHPRRFGLACHLGLHLDLPTVGCAKSRLIGQHRDPAPLKGSRCRLLDHAETIGTVLRTRDHVKCVYVSVGHRIELPQAVRLVLRCCRQYRLPEPTRLAHQIVTKLRSQPTIDKVDGLT